MSVALDGSIVPPPRDRVLHSKKKRQRKKKESTLVFHMMRYLYATFLMQQPCKRVDTINQCSPKDREDGRSDVLILPDLQKKLKKREGPILAAKKVGRSYSH